MPELPDVEAFRRVLTRHALDRPIQRVEVLDSGVLHGVSARQLDKSLRHGLFTAPRRHGKWLIVPVDGTGGCPIVLLHFGMTGSLAWGSDRRDRHPHDRIVFDFPDGELRFRDMRKLQGLRLCDGEADLGRLLAGLGPDAAAVSREEFRELIGGQHRQLKAALVDQSVIAGLGNLLADEILWRARIHPRRQGARLDRAELDRLHRTMGSVLRQSVAAGRVPPRKSWLTGRRDEESGSCPRCGTMLTHGRLGGRGTVWCPRCQPG